MPASPSARRVTDGRRRTLDRGTAAPDRRSPIRIHCRRRTQMKLISIVAPLFAALVLLAACGASDEQSAPRANSAASGRRADPGHARRGRHPQLRPAARGPGPPCRARPRRRFRREAHRRHRDPRHRAQARREGDRPRRQGPRDRERHRRPRQPLHMAGRRQADPNLGAPLAIALRPDTKRIVIRYKSAPDAGALQWLTPAADRRQEGALSVQPGPGDREPQLDSDPGFARHPPELGSDHPRSRRPDRGDERAARAPSRSPRAARACSASGCRTASRPI